MAYEYLFDNLTFKFPYDVSEYLKNPIMENYHYHSSDSNPMTPDSPTSNREYAVKIKEYGAKCIFSGEHGWQGNQFEVNNLANEFGLKYRHSTEAYWVRDRHESDNSNCHICIVATNDRGRKQLNYILSEANISGYYYKPRIDLELILSLEPSDFIVTSACVAGWKYTDSDQIWLKIWKHFGDNFFLEVQYHDTDAQKKLNAHIAKLSGQYGIQLICGLDSHYINVETDDIKRTELLAEKGIKYEDEEGWYLDYPDFTTVYQRLVKQGVLNTEQILLSLINTNVFNSDKFKDCHFSKEFKIPNIYKDMNYEQRCDYYKKLLYDAYALEEEQTPEREQGIEYEASQFIESKTVDYPLITKAIIDLATSPKYGGVLTTTSRGSAGSFYTNKLIGLTTLDRFKSEVPIYPERFLTKERVLSGQMPDCDLNISTQEPFVKATRELLGEQGCYPLMTIGYLKEKSAFKMYARLNNVPPTAQNEITKGIDKYNETLKYADEDEREFINIEDYIPQEYLDIYVKSKEYQGIIDRVGVHACGHLIFDGDIRYEIGLIYAVSKSTGKKTLCACAEGKYLDDYGYVKEDFLIVDSVTLIHKFWQSIGQEVPSMNELRRLITDDKNTWDIYANGITCCVNQMEKDSTTRKCMKYKPKNLGELASIISAIRPGFSTLVDKFISRIEYTTGEEAIDKLLEDSAHWMLFQESIMKVLNYCGLEMNDTYGVIKSISKKKFKAHPEKLVELKEKLKKGWVEEIGNLDNFDNVWGVIEASASYSFNAPHALSMGGDSAYQAYFKAHYTSKFYEVAINHYIEKENKNKVNKLIDEAISRFGYKLKACQFGEDNRTVKVNDEDKTIVRSFDSIKGMQKIAPQVLYEMGQKKYPSLFHIFKDLKWSELNKKSLDIIFKLDYFSEYGDINYILQQWEVYNQVADIYNKLRSAKKLTKATYEPYFDMTEFAKFGKETLKQIAVEDSEGLIKYALSVYPSVTKVIEKNVLYKPVTQLERMVYQCAYNGACDIIDESQNDNIFIVSSVEENKYGTPFITMIQCNSGKTITFKGNKWTYSENKCESGDIIMTYITEQNKRIKGEDGEWINTDETETIIKDYAIVRKFDK